MKATLLLWALSLANAQEAKDASCAAARKFRPGQAYHLSGVDVSQAVYKWHKKKETGRCATWQGLLVKDPDIQDQPIGLAFHWRLFKNIKTPMLDKDNREPESGHLMWACAKKKVEECRSGGGGGGCPMTVDLSFQVPRAGSNRYQPCRRGPSGEPDPYNGEIMMVHFNDISEAECRAAGVRDGPDISGCGGGEAGDGAAGAAAGGEYGTDGGGGGGEERLDASQVFGVQDPLPGECTVPVKSRKDHFGTVKDVGPGYIDIETDRPRSCGDLFYLCGDLRYHPNGYPTRPEFWFGTICRVVDLGGRLFRVYVGSGRRTRTPQVGTSEVYFHWQACVANIYDTCAAAWSQ